MAKQLKWFTDEANALIERDVPLRKMQAQIVKHATLQWQLPEEMGRMEWLRPIRSTMPYDALRGATRALSHLEENIKVDPISVLKGLPQGTECSSLLAREKANDWERVLKWNLSLAANRQAILRSDIVRSALLFDEVCIQSVHLPTQIKALKSLGGDPQRQEAALRYGPFAILVHDPRTIHTRFSSYMLEAVLMTKVMEPQAIVDFYGQAAGELAKLIRAESAEDAYSLFDYVSLESRCIMAVPGDRADNVNLDGAIEIVREDYTDRFLPWACVIGGTKLDERPEHQRLPMLYPVVQAEQWLNSNIAATLLMSDAISHAAAPTLAISGPTADKQEIDYTDPSKTVALNPGNTVSPLPPPQMQAALREAADRFEQAMNVATLSRVLITSEATPGETFSGFNLRIQTALGSLTPYKELAERAEANLCRIMLYQVEASGEPLSGYGTKDKKQSKYTIDSEDIDVDHLHITISLKTDVPIDRQQRVNSAVMMSDKLKYPPEKILEELGDPDPEGSVEMWYQSQYDTAYLQGQLQRIAAEASGQLQQMAAQMAQKMLQQQQVQAQQQAEQQGQGSQPNPMNGPGMPGVGGQGFATNMGGQPPAQANPPANVREQQMGETRLGEELA